MSARIVCGDIVIDSNEIKTIKVIEEPEILSAVLRSTTLDVTLSRNTIADIVEHENEVFVLQYGNGIEMKTCIAEYKQESKNTWKLEFGDYISILEKHEFHGDVYDGKNSRELVFEIFEKAGFYEGDFLIDKTLFELTPTVTGYIPYTTCKEALRQVLFVLGAMATTLNGKPNIISISRDMDSIEIPQNRTLENVKIDFGNGTQYDSAKVTLHKYSTGGEIETLHNKGYGNPSRTEENPEILSIVFDSPHYDIEVIGSVFPSTAGKFVYTILESSANHIVMSWYITSGTSVTIVIRGRPYQYSSEEIIIKSGNSSDRTYTIDDKDFMTESNAEPIAMRCLDYYSNNNKTIAKVVIGKHILDDGSVVYDEDVYCGDIVTIPTDYQGTYTGRIIKEQYNLDGNIIIKEITVK